MPDRKQFCANIIQSRITKWFIYFLLLCLPVMATLSDYGVTYDEPIYMEASRSIQKWLSLEPRKIFNQQEIDRNWRTDPVRNVHPSGLKWLYMFAQKTIFWERDPYTRNRVLNVFIFSVSLLIFLHWWSGNILVRVILFILLLLTIPRFFAHTHFAATDLPMTSLLLLFLVSLEKTILKKSFWLTGIVFGIFLSIKITSSLLALPILLAFLVLYRHEWKIVLRRIILICMAGLLVFYILNPDWWFAPLSRSWEFFTQTMTRQTWTPFTVYFNGQFYNYRAPFYYPFTMFLITTPLLHTLLMLSGLIFFFINRELRNKHKMILVFISFVFPFLILALPISPAHDGIRYLLPAFPFAACFMTLGLERLWQFVKEPSTNSFIKRPARWVVAALAITLLAVDLHAQTRYPPYELSYYNRIVGGLSGARHKGYETTYWYEIINDSVLERLNKFCAGSTVYFPLPPTDLFFKHMIDAQKIDFLPVLDPEKANFMLIIGRPFVRFWEMKTWPIYREEGKIPIPLWDISLDSVPLLQLYMIR